MKTDITLLTRPRLDYRRAANPRERSDWDKIPGPIRAHRKGRAVLNATCFFRSDTRSRVVAKAMARGIESCGDRVVSLNTEKFAGRPLGDVAIFYGFKGQGREIYQAYMQAGLIVVFIDLGYWCRRAGGRKEERYMGHHRFAVCNRHASNTVMAKKHPPDRLNRLRSLPQLEKGADLHIRPWVQGEKILLAGSQAKSSFTYGMDYMEWELAALKLLRENTSREIVYRPKPKDPQAAPIPGTTFSHRSVPLAQELRNCHAVVTHHSNVGVDALCAGVPVFCFDGIAKPLALTVLSSIETPYYPKDEVRQQWLQNVAYWQWSVPEMESGEAWRFLKRSGALG